MPNQASLVQCPTSEQPPQVQGELLKEKVIETKLIGIEIIIFLNL